MATIEEFKDQQRRQWSGNAPAWDSQHDARERETGAVTDWLCHEAALVPGMRALDLACGSGHPSLTIAQLIGRDGSLVSTDLVQEMVAVTKRRLAEAGFTNAETHIMDAEAINFPDGTFDAVVCRFGLMFCPRPEQAVSEVRRVLKIGSRFALSVWSEPQLNPGQTIAEQTLRRAGRPQPEVNFDLPGVYQLAPPGKLQRLLEAAGFREVRVEPITLTSEFESIESFLAPTSTRSRALRTALHESTPEEAERLKAALAEVLAPYTSPDGVIRLTLTPLCAAATK